MKVSASISKVEDLSFTAKGHDGFHLTVTGNFMALAFARPSFFKRIAKFSDHRMLLRQRRGSFLGIRQRKVQPDFHSDREIGLLQLCTECFGRTPCEVGKTNNHMNALQIGICADQPRSEEHTSE